MEAKEVIFFLFALSFVCIFLVLPHFASKPLYVQWFIFSLNMSAGFAVCFLLVFFFDIHTSARLFWSWEFLAAFVSDTTVLLMFFFPVVITLIWVIVQCQDILCHPLCGTLHPVAWAWAGICDTACTQTQSVSEVEQSLHRAMWH